MDSPFKNFDASKFSLSGSDNGQSGADTATQDAQVDDDGSLDADDPTSTDTDAGADQASDDATADDGVDTAQDDQATEDDTQADDTVDGTATEGQDVSDEFYNEEDFNEDIKSYVSDLTKGKISDPQQIVNILQENEALKAQLANKELTFPSEEAKVLYNYATKFPGTDLAAASQYLHVQKLNLATLSPKDKQLEAYVLGRPDISREKAATLFNATYDKKYTDIEDDIVLKDDHDVATRQAETKILQMQKEFQDAKTEQARVPEQAQSPQNKEFEDKIASIVSDFGGLTMSYGDSPSDVVNMPLSAEEASEFQAMLVNPTKLLDRIVDQCTVNGKFNESMYTQRMYALANMDKLLMETRKNGLTAGQLKVVQERKNTTLPKKSNGMAPPPKKSYAQTMAEAVQLSNQRKN